MTNYTRSSITIDATPGEIMNAIADFTSYPTWASEVTTTEIIEPGTTGRPAQVRLIIDGGALRDDQIHAYQWDGDRAVHWTLITSRILRGRDGSYTLTPRPHGRTEVTYQLNRALPSLKRHVEAGKRTR